MRFFAQQPLSLLYSSFQSMVIFCSFDLIRIVAVQFIVVLFLMYVGIVYSISHFAISQF